MLITLDWLREKGACADAVKRFEETYGQEGAEYQDVLDALAKENNASWASWLIQKAGRTNAVLEVDGDLVVEASIFFSGFIKATGRIAAKHLMAGWGIEAGEGIKAGGGIKAGEGIEAGGGIEAGEGIKAGGGIEAGEGIKAGWDIEAGWGIEAGGDYGIYAGLRIRISLKSKYALVIANVRPENIVLGEFKERT